MKTRNNYGNKGEKRLEIIEFELKSDLIFSGFKGFLGFEP